MIYYAVYCHIYSWYVTTPLWIAEKTIHMLLDNQLIIHLLPKWQHLLVPKFEFGLQKVCAYLVMTVSYATMTSIHNQVPIWTEPRLWLFVGRILSSVDFLSSYELDVRRYYDHVDQIWPRLSGHKFDFELGGSRTPSWPQSGIHEPEWLSIVKYHIWNRF